MKKSEKKPVAAKALLAMANKSLTSAANSRCVFFYHQPKQPDGVDKFRKF